MRRRMLPSVASAVALWALLIGVLPQVVLCVGSDGHVAVEGVCCRGLLGEAGFSGRSPDCPPDCTDTNLGFSAGTGAFNPASVLSLRGHASALALPAWQGTAAILGAAAPTRQVVSEQPPPRALRTTVIRC